jgi:hypothetical protein
MPQFRTAKFITNLPGPVQTILVRLDPPMTDLSGRLHLYVIAKMQAGIVTMLPAMPDGTIKWAEGGHANDLAAVGGALSFTHAFKQVGYALDYKGDLK